MSGYLLDTNILSELRKGDRCDQRLIQWFESVEDDELFVSVLVLGEIRKGVELVRENDPPKAIALESWLRTLESNYADRILPITRDVADQWGRLCAIRPLPTVDGLLASTALTLELTLVTRNTIDLKNTGVLLFNPFAN